MLNLEMQMLTLYYWAFIVLGEFTKLMFKSRVWNFHQFMLDLIQKFMLL
uniref:Uncharacterized protein n=1 Tax=Arundo donax TaxID=35708 RepID=A0A0A9BDD4_ARUDO